MTKKSIIIELACVSIPLLLITHVCHRLQSISFFHEYSGIIFALLFIYVPILVMWKRGRSIDFLDDSVAGYLKSIGLFSVVSLIVFPPFILCAHLWQVFVLGNTFVGVHIPDDILTIVAYQVLLIALPEEFFFRGYCQSLIKRYFDSPWKILGVKLGFWWIALALFFAFAHSFVMIQWWHFSIFFPALLFSYLRERRGTITASILFHALSNIVMIILVMSYVSS
jgi:membrane protease YdiL (CAAX protease family)